MENASKALIMAGTVLISMIIIGAAVMMYRSLTSSEREQEKSVKIKQLAEFNKAYTAYEKNLYGSELLSLANRMADYNKKVKERWEGYEGFSSMSLTVTVDGKKMQLGGLEGIRQSVESIKDRYSDQEMQQYISLLNNGKELPDNSASEKEIKAYSQYIEFKRKMLQHKKTTYDDKSGRIQSMTFEEITK